ncbi:hypothetical protein AC480_01925 [miscellaneous Crenarchaeota group archaeon SMTZ1-55]|nr:MAG: hypothetical protein AC480_01925 [miscellaneous Crenarchaeota group archaeon SMTZ1-55]
MGRIAKGTKCSIIDCDEVAVRSISTPKVEATGLQVAEQRRVYLCRQHYKEYKKKSKNDRKIERWRWTNG